MTITRAAVPLLGITALALGMANTFDRTGSHSQPSKHSLRLDAKTEAALDTLHEEIQRRFHDRNEVDFGFSRLVRSGNRAHNVPPLMERGFFRSFGDKNGLEFRPVPATAQTPAHTEVKDPELGWTEINKLRPTMNAENDREKQAITALREAKADIAIYTFGLLGQTGIEPRAKGPGYISQKAANGPAPADLLKYVQQAWRAGSDDVVVEGPNGWYLMAHRVEATTEACVTCHAHTRQAAVKDRQVPAEERVLYKTGDDLGMVIIAIHPRTPR